MVVAVSAVTHGLTGAFRVKNERVGKLECDWHVPCKMNMLGDRDVIGVSRAKNERVRGLGCDLVVRFPECLKLPESQVLHLHLHMFSLCCVDNFVEACGDFVWWFV